MLHYVTLHYISLYCIALRYKLYTAWHTCIVVYVNIINWFTAYVLHNV